MINASAEFREKLKDGAEVQTYADITLSDGTVLHLTPDDIWLGGCTIDDKTTDGKFGVGFAIGKTLSLRIANHDERFSVYDFYNSIINLYVAMRLDDGTIEKIRKGVYYTTVPETPGDIIEISAADGMYRLDRDYTNSATAYPASLQTIITAACLDCGIPVGFRQFDNMSFVVQEKPEKATYRQVVSWACQIAGYNARIDNNGYMQLVWYDTSLMDGKVYDGGDFLTYPHDTEVDGGDFLDYSAVKIIDGGLFTDAHLEHIFRFKNLTVHTDDVSITGVQVVHEDTDVLFGEKGYVIKIDGNSLVAGKESQVATYLGQLMVGMCFRPFSGSVLGNPLYEPFDVCKVSDRKGNAYQSIINSVSYTVGSYTEIACQAEDPVRNGSSYFSESAAAVVEARRNTEKQLTEYDKAVQAMSQIAMNAMGFHTTYEEQTDGSRIVYLHDKPNLSDSKVIFKQSIDGFFVSQDGGQSYVSGFDSQGNAVLNVLYAIGIIADWIHGGTLSLGGKNNTNGTLYIYDENGYLIGYWTNSGIWASRGVFGGELRSASGTFSGTIRVSNQFVSDTHGNCFLRNPHFVSNIYMAKYMMESGNIEDLEYELTLYKMNQSLRVGNTKDFYLFVPNLGVSGTKSRIVNTQDYLDRLMYCYEMPSPMFGDVGIGKTDDTGVCYVYFDLIFQETITSEMVYYVFLQEEGEGSLHVEEKHADYFSVKGTPNLSFSWEVKVKQKKYEYNRMEPLDVNGSIQDVNYEEKAQNYLQKFEKEILGDEEIN